MDAAPSACEPGASTTNWRPGTPGRGLDEGEPVRTTPQGLLRSQQRRGVVPHRLHLLTPHAGVPGGQLVSDAAGSHAGGGVSRPACLHPAVQCCGSARTHLTQIDSGAPRCGGVRSAAWPYPAAGSAGSRFTDGNSHAIRLVRFRVLGGGVRSPGASPRRAGSVKSFSRMAPSGNSTGRSACGRGRRRRAIPGSAPRLVVSRGRHSHANRLGVPRAGGGVQSAGWPSPGGARC